MSKLAHKLGEFSFQHYQSWPEHERWQLLDGQAFAMAPPSWSHQSVVFELGAQLRNALQGHPCQARVAPVGVRLPKHDEADEHIRTVFEPDLFIVCDASKIDAKGVRGAPDVIFEVLSPSTADFDQIEKRAAYERAGVRELWFIDAASGVITIFRHSGDSFATPDYRRAEGTLEVHAIPGLKLELDFMKALRATPESI
jgi:Uma2 family endonuclease